jgi:Protein of unknown function (DUF3433)
VIDAYTDIRTLHPYLQLAKHDASPSSTILVPFYSHPVTALFGSLRGGIHLFPAFISFIVLLSEVMTVAIAGVPYSSASSYTAYTVSTFLSIGIIGIMLFALVLVYFVFMRDPLELPRRPDTVANTLSFLCGSKAMVRSLKDLACVDGRERRKVIVGMRRRYKLDIGVGMDGKERWTIDEAGSGGSLDN